MRITKGLRLRLRDLFARRMFELGFDDDRPVATWTEYLESVGCRRVHGVKAPRGFVLVEDPIWHGDEILAPRELALKALVLECLP